eukprot:COSAG02_NODE_229_length_28128_cov_18.529131_24_plen_49_part_00
MVRNKSIDGRPVTLDQLEDRLENIDAEFNRESPKPDKRQQGSCLIINK